jgi:hypothetical protein
VLTGVPVSSYTLRGRHGCFRHRRWKIESALKPQNFWGRVSKVAVISRTHNHTLLSLRSAAGISRTHNPSFASLRFGHFSATNPPSLRSGSGSGCDFSEINLCNSFAQVRAWHASKSMLCLGSSPPTTYYTAMSARRLTQPSACSQPPRRPINHIEGNGSGQ